MVTDGIIRVLVMHPNRIFREGLAFVLAQQEELSVVSSVGHIREVIGQLEVLQPDVCVIDVREPSKEGLGDLREIRSRLPAAKVLVTGLRQHDSDALACIEAGAGGYLSEEASLQDLVENVRAVASGEAICSRKIMGLLFSRVAEVARERQRGLAVAPPRVTPREREIISLINAGLSNKEIAVQLRIETQTVKNHVHNILEKLQIEGRRALLQYVKDQKLWATLHTWVLVLVTS